MIWWIIEQVNLIIGGSNYESVSSVCDNIWDKLELDKIEKLKKYELEEIRIKDDAKDKKIELRTEFKNGKWEKYAEVNGKKYYDNKIEYYFAEEVKRIENKKRLKELRYFRDKLKEKKNRNGYQNIRKEYNELLTDRNFEEF